MGYTRQPGIGHRFGEEQCGDAQSDTQVLPRGAKVLDAVLSKPRASLARPSRIEYSVVPRGVVNRGIPAHLRSG